jgi:spore coat-associated protein S
MEKERHAKSLEQQHEDLKTVLAHYPVSVKKITMLFTRGGRTKWLVTSDRGDLFLRQESVDPRRLEFIAAAHRHLEQNGLPIAKLIETIHGGLCLCGEDHGYLLYEADQGEPLQYYDRSHVLKATAFIAAFHRASNGYAPPATGKPRTRAGKWHSLYRWKIQELESNRRLAEAHPTDTFSRMFLAEVDRKLEVGRAALADLDQPFFRRATKAAIAAQGFCQQDFTLARMTLRDDQAFMKDLHSITADLPERDLRIFMNKVMKKLSVWDGRLAGEMLAAYDQVQPLNEDNLRVLRTDLRFPHLFCGLTHKYFLGQKKSWGDEKYVMNFRKIIAVEQSKQDFLNRSNLMPAKTEGGGGENEEK